MEPYGVLLTTGIIGFIVACIGVLYAIARTRRRAQMQKYAMLRAYTHGYDLGHSIGRSEGFTDGYAKGKYDGSFEGTAERVITELENIANGCY